MKQTLSEQTAKRLAEKARSDTETYTCGTCGEQREACAPDDQSRRWSLRISYGWTEGFGKMFCSELCRLHGWLRNIIEGCEKAQKKHERWAKRNGFSGKEFYTPLNLLDDEFFKDRIADVQEKIKLEENRLAAEMEQLKKFAANPIELPPVAPCPFCGFPATWYINDPPPPSLYYMARIHCTNAESGNLGCVHMEAWGTALTQGNKQRMLREGVQSLEVKWNRRAYPND